MASTFAELRGELNKNKKTGSTNNSGKVDAYQLWDKKKLGLDTLEEDLNSLGNTINGIYGGWQTEETMRNTRKAVEEMHKRVTDLQTYQRKYGSLGIDADSLVKSYQSVLDDWDKRASMYSDYKNADDYNEAKKKLDFESQFYVWNEDGTYRGLTFDEVQKRKAQYAVDSEEYKYLDRYAGYDNLLEYDKAIKATKDRKNALEPEPITDEAKLDEMMMGSPVDIMKDAEKANGEYIAEHEYLSELERDRNLHALQHQFDYWERYTEADDFEEKCQYVSTFDEKGNYDKEYEYINNTEGVRDALREDAGNKRPASGYGAMAIYQNYVNPYETKGYDYLLPEEVALYNYFVKYDKENGTDKVREFLEDMEVTLSYRKYLVETGEWKEAAENNPVAMSVLSVPANIVGAFTGGIDAISDAVQGKRYNPFGYAKTLSNFASDTRQYVGENIAENTNFELFGQNIPAFLYQTLMSSVDSAAGATIFGTGFSAVMGSTAFQSKAKELKEAGASDEQIWRGAFIAGGAEMFGEYFSLDKLLKIKDVDSWGKFWKATFKQAGIEGSEEVFTEIMNIVGDVANRGEMSDFEQTVKRYADEGLSDSEAFMSAVWDYAGQTAWAGVGGALSGLGMGGAHSGGQFNGLRSVGKDIRNNGRVQEMMELQGLTPVESDTYKLYTEYAKKGITADNIKNARLGNLYTTSMRETNATLHSDKATVAQKADAMKRLSKLREISTPNIDEQERQERVQELKTGKVTKVTSTGASTKLEGIRVKDDKTVVITSEGEVAAEDMTFTKNDAELLSCAEIMGDEKGSLFLEQYDGKSDVEDYRRSFNMAYTYGETGFGADSVLQNKGVLTEKQAAEIYKKAVLQKAAGRQRAIDEINAKYADTAVVPGTFDDSIIDYDSKTKDGSKVNWNKLSERQRKAVTFAKAFAKVTGVNIRFIQSRVVNGAHVGKNGSYDPTTNTIEIDVYAGIEANVATEAIIPTLSHEMTHWMKAKAPAMYRKMTEYVSETFVKDGKNSEELIEDEMDRIKRNHPNTKVTEEMAIDELVARACEDMLSNSKVAREMLGTLSESEQKSFVAKVKETIKKLIDWVNDLLGQYKSNSEEAQILRKYGDRLEELSKMWDQALAEAVRTNQNLQREGVTGEQVLTKAGLSIDSETQSVYSTRQIIGVSGKNYGMGVYLDSTLLTGLTESERKEMVKLFVTNELAGNHFTAFDSSNYAVDMMIANKNDTIRNKNNKKKQVISELYKKNNYLSIKQESVVLIDELIANAKYDSTKVPAYPHDWLDNYGKNNWEYWTVYMQEQNGTVWKATLNVANTAKGDKILYDIDPIKMVEGAVKSASNSTNTNVAQNPPAVKQNSDRGVHAPTFYSHMGRVIDGIKQNKMSANGVVSYLKGKGVKDEEIKWSGIEAFLDGKKSVTKEELQAFAVGSQLQIEEEVRTDSKDKGIKFKTTNDTKELYRNGELVETFTKDAEGWWVAKSNPSEPYFNEQDITEAYEKVLKWDEYKLKGGKNYREILFKLPNESHSNNAMKGHWGAKTTGVLAHARIQDMRVNGKKMLFIEEIQSDWHNEGHKIGYAEKGKKRKGEIRNESADALHAFLESDVITAIRSRLYNNGYTGTVELLAKVFDGNVRAYSDLVYDANLTSDERAFIDNVIKEEAGRQSELENAPSDIAVKDAPFRDTYHEYVMKRLLREAAENGYDCIGWTTADIQSKRWSDEFAEGYRIEYDQDIPRFMNKYGKKWGGKVTTTTLKNGEEVWEFTIPDAMKESVLYEGQVMYSDRMSLDEQIDKAVQNQLPRRQSIYFGNTSDILQKVGLSDLPVLYTQKHLRDALAPKDPKKHQHGIKKQQLLNIPANLEKPVMILDSWSKNDSIIVVTEMFDQDQCPIIVSIRPNGSGMMDVQVVGSNFITSVYGRNGFKNFIETAINNNAVLYVNKVKSQKLYQQVRVQFPQGLTKLGFDKIIHQSNNIVKQNSIQHSDRNSDYIDPRELLSGALTSVAQNDKEREVLKQYQEHIDIISIKESELAEINKQIKELSFSPGTRDTKKLEYLKRRRDKLRNSINYFDKKLLSLEATSTLKGVLEREKAKVEKRIKQKAKENLDAYKGRMSKKAEIESIKQNALVLSRWLTKNTKDQHIPEDLKEPVKNLLVAIDFASRNTGVDTSDHAEVLAQISKNVKEARAKVDLRANLTALKNAAAKSEELQRVGVDFDDEIENLTNSIAELALQSDALFVLKDMSVEDLATLNKIVKTLKTVITKANKYYTMRRTQSISASAHELFDLFDALGKVIEGKISGVGGFFNYDNITPIYFFDRLGEVGKDLFHSFIKALDTQAFLAKEVMEFSKKTWGEKGYAKKWGKDLIEFEVVDVKKTTDINNPVMKKVYTTTSRLMTLYLHSQREQSKGHLYNGGGGRFTKFKHGIDPYGEDVDGVALTPELVQQMLKKLDPKAREVADKISEFFNGRCKDLGNEITTDLYGTKLFTEEKYVPIEVIAESVSRKTDKQNPSITALLNKGFTKETKPNAKNQIVLDDIFDVFAKHTTEMINYNAYARVVYDAVRLFNYEESRKTFALSEEGNDVPYNIKTAMRGALGDGAVEYFEQFLIDVNGTQPTSKGRIDRFMGKLFTNSKLASVAHNINVGLLQPISLIRASTMINPLYLARGFAHIPDGIKKASENSGTALHKSFGYYETDISMTLEEQIKNDKTWLDKHKELSMKSPEIGDRLTWGVLYKACEYQISAQNKDLKKDSPEFTNKVVDLFEETIFRTQVMDSVLTRSQIMRSKSAAAKGITSFMSEPTVTYNMVYGIFSEWNQYSRSGHTTGECRKMFGKKLAGAIGVYCLSAVAEAAVRTLTTAMRNAGADDDDEDKNVFLDQFWSAINPLTKIPGFRDLWSTVIEGYDATELSGYESLTALSKAYEAMTQMIFEGKDVSYKRVHKILQAVSYPTGHGLSNAMRDVVAIWNSTFGKMWPSKIIPTK